MSSPERRARAETTSATRPCESGPLDEYRADDRGEDYWTLLRVTASAQRVPETIAGHARILGCGREHAKTVATNLLRKGLVRLVWHPEVRQWNLDATEAGREVLRDA